MEGQEEQEIIGQNMDHLGLVAAVCRELKIRERIDERIFDGDERRRVTPGQAVTAMIINGLGFVDHRLYMVESFFENKPVDRLLGEGMRAEYLNDYTLGHALDEIHNYGITNLFMEIMDGILNENDLRSRFRRIDSTSIYVEGAYEDYPESELHLMHGYSKDHRPDLKQFMVSLSVTGAAELPNYLDVHDGNTSDAKKFPKVIERIRKFESNLKTAEDVIYVADAALYNEENVLSMTGTKWISRVPETIRQCKDIINIPDDKINWTEQGEKYRTCEFQSEYGQIKQRWVLVHSDAACRKERASFEDRFEQISEELDKAVEKFENREFSTEEIGRQELKKFEKKYKYHEIGIKEIREVRHYLTPGRHSEKEIPAETNCRFILKYSPDREAVEAELNAKGRFVLATNVAESELDSKTVLEEYKNQQHTERGFRFLKDSKFMADEIYLKKPDRIQALMMIMTLCLAVYKYSQYKIRRILEETDDTLPNQKKKEIQNPTMKWLFQKMLGVIVLRLNPGTPHEKIIMSNIDRTRQKIIRLFGIYACEIYSINTE